jgi:hypothetical protein
VEQPQSQEEIAPIEAELRKLDSQLRIRWNPKAIMVSRGTIDAVGHSGEPIYAGRWQVERIAGESNLAPSVIYVVREDGKGKEAYKAVGFWLVDFFNKWDAGQRHFLDLMRQAWAEHDAVEEARGKISDEGGAQQFLEEEHFKLAGKHFIGRGFNAQGTSKQ